MTTSATLQDLARQVRRSTIQILEAARTESLTFAPPGTTNHMLWHAGHTLWLQDVLCVELLTGKRKLPLDWDETFGMNCRPIQQTKDWPSRDQLLELLHSQLQKILGLLEHATEAQLATPADPRRGPATTPNQSFTAGTMKPNTPGEMYLLFKLSRDKP